MSPAGDPPVRLPELIAALSLGIDLGIGQPTEHVLRSCLIAGRLAEAIDAEESEREAAYYLSLLAWVGCTSDASELAAWFGDDIGFRRATYDVDLAGLPLFGFMLRQVGAGRPPWQRARMAAALVREGNRGAEESMEAHCEAAMMVADRLGLGTRVREPMGQLFARWDGKGVPSSLRGDAIRLSVRLFQLADLVESHRTSSGEPAALRVAHDRAGSHLDPSLVAELDRHADEVFAGLDGDTTWEEVVAAEPGHSEPLHGERLDEGLRVVADFADLKSPYFRGHSRGVAALAEAAAPLLGLPPAEAEVLRRAALVHDLGRAGISNAIWDKPGPLTASERERVRLHPYYTERALARPEALARLGVVAAAHHERLDGSGYHRGIGGGSLSQQARLLAVADAYHAMTEPRPHRPALDRQDAASELRREVRAGRLDAGAAEAVLAAAGHRTAARRRSAPAGLTPRELEVLVLLSRGASNKEIARTLVIADKTAKNHVEHIYAKLDVSSRTTAALYAMRHGLLETLEPLEKDEAIGP